MRKSAVSIFVCHSNQDDWFLKEKSAMASALKLLEQRGVDVWWDKEINAGEDWGHEIRKQLEKADIAVCLVSLNFLASDYIMKVEARRLLERRSRNGLYIFPVLLSECPWEEYKWIKKAQALPRGKDKYIRPHYANKKPEICTQIYRHLRKLVKKLQKPRKRKPSPLAKPVSARKFGGLSGADRLEAQRLYFLRRKQWNGLTLRESQKLQRDAEGRATKIEPNLEIWERICQRGKALIKTKGGMALTKKQLELLDRPLARGSSRKPDAFNPRWILRARGLHPQGRDTRNTWRYGADGLMARPAAR